LEKITVLSISDLIKLYLKNCKKLFEKIKNFFV
jgi:hypothetical protein